jgi:hypothetical protein
VASFILQHAHQPTECRHAFAAWKGYDSPLRHRSTMGSCAEGGHELWWTVEAADEAAAQALLPPYLAERVTIRRVAPVPIP